MAQMPKRLPADGVPSAAPYDRPSSADKATDALNSEIAALGDLDLYKLRERWLRFYHRPAPRFFRRDLLIRGIAYEMQAKAFGGSRPKPGASCKGSLPQPRAVRASLPPISPVACA